MTGAGPGEFAAAAALVTLLVRAHHAVDARDPFRGENRFSAASTTMAELPPSYRPLRRVNWTTSSITIVTVTSKLAVLACFDMPVLLEVARWRGWIMAAVKPRPNRKDRPFMKRTSCSDCVHVLCQQEEEGDVRLLRAGSLDLV